MCSPTTPPRTGPRCWNATSRRSPRRRERATIRQGRRFRAANARSLRWRASRNDAAMKLVVFGLSVSSSWGNGHAVLWRALIRALAADGHWVVFFERDVPWYAQHRDLTELEGGRLVLYGDWEAIRPEARRELRDVDAAMGT